MVILSLVLLNMIEVHNIPGSVCHGICTQSVVRFWLYQWKLKSNLRFGIYNQQVHTMPCRTEYLEELTHFLKLHLNWRWRFHKTKQNSKNWICLCLRQAPQNVDRNMFKWTKWNLTKFKIAQLDQLEMKTKSN